MRRSVRVAVAGLAAAVSLGAAACGQDERFLPYGEFSGSTSDDRPFTILVGDKPKVNGLEADWEGRGRLKLKKAPGRPVVSCVRQADDEELRCEVPRPEADGGVETIELMRK